MKAVLPGKPEAQLQALATGFWDGRRIIAYITGNAFAILYNPDTLVQTIYDADPDVLEAIAIDEASGKIATCTSSAVRVYKPLRHGRFQLKWVLEATLTLENDPGTSAPSLSWGSSEELLVGRTNLRLYQTGPKEPSIRWEKRLANPVKFARISYDSNYIACVGYYDHLVKVWRRLGDSFEFCYLRHPAPITGLRWRQPHDTEESIVNVLYTFCADNKLRIWTGGRKLQLPKLWGELDLGSSIRDRDAQQNGHASNRRWAFILDSRDFESAAAKAVVDGPQDDVALPHLATVAKRSPDMCLVFDGRGNMSAWGLEEIGYDTKPSIYNITHVKSGDLEFLQNSEEDPPPYLKIYDFANRTAGHLHVLLHHFDGRIQIYESNIAELLNPTPTTDRLSARCNWSGHSAAIRKIVRNYSGRVIVSRTAGGESIVWRHPERKTKLCRWSMIPEAGHIHRICVLRKGRFVVFLMHDAVCVWDCRSKHAKLLGQCKYTVSGKPLCVLILPRRHREDFAIAHIATVTSENDGIVWEVQLPLYKDRQMRTQNGTHTAEIREFCRFRLPGATDLAYVLPVDPAGSPPVISGFLDVFARDVAMSWTHSGYVEFWTARVDRERSKVEWLATASFDTGVTKPSLASGSTMKKAAMVNTDRNEVSIWDIKGSQLEFAQAYEDQTIQDLDWTSTPDSQSILAVGFQSRLVLLSQLRFDYLTKGPAWAAVREINLDATTTSIGDSTWLGDGHLVVGAGNQLYLYGREYNVSSSIVADLRLPTKKSGTWDLFEVVQRLNGPLPVFHPQFLSQCMLAGKTALVHRILMALSKVLKFYVDGDTIDDYLGIDPSEFISAQVYMEAKSILDRRQSVDDEHGPFSEEIAEYINAKLTKIPLPQLSGHEQIQLVDIVECAGVVEKQRRSMDENGARFMLFFRQHALRKGRTNEAHISWREIVWAYHSNCHDILSDFITRQHSGTLLWENARESGLFMWLTEPAAVRKQFEIIARNEYTKGEWKDPRDCSLYYLALKKKTVLQGLWRMASWNREQPATMRLLANDFTNPKWKTTALKNAYALMSKRRFEYAAAFFLLADSLSDAVSVCLHQLHDMQLAIAVARVYEGDDSGPVLRKLLKEDVLTIAAHEGNRWMASWAFWMLGRRDMAVRALITPTLYPLVLRFQCPPQSPQSPPPGMAMSPPDRKAKLFLTDDPALVVLYSQLRQKTLQTLRGAAKVGARTEWEFVLHNARLYDRMGCDLLGLDLVRNWEFLRDARSVERGLGGEIKDPRTLLRRRTSLVVQDMDMEVGSEQGVPEALRAALGGVMGMESAVVDWNDGEGEKREENGVEPKKTKVGLGVGSDGRETKLPTMFHEPDANSLLDSFGF